MVEKSLSDIAAQIKEELSQLQITEKSAVLEARELSCFAAGVDRRDFLRLKNEKVVNLVHPVRELMDLRKEGMPVAYIIGEWDFFGRTFFIDKHVLIPRDDSAAVIELLLLKLITKSPDKTLKILDLCTGSGCLGITAVLELYKNAQCVLADISEEALEVASKNIILHDLSDIACTIKADIFSPIPEGFSGFDAILCNPPYVSSEDITLLDDSVSKYEPMIALDGGGDGLSFFREIIRVWSGVLEKDGVLCFEVGIGQAQTVAEIMRQNGFGKIDVRRDLSGIERAVCGFKQE